MYLITINPGSYADLLPHFQQSSKSIHRCISKIFQLYHRATIIIDSQVANKATSSELKELTQFLEKEDIAEIVIDLVPDIIVEIIS